MSEQDNNDNKVLPNPLPLPTVKQVAEVAKTVNMATAEGQTKIAETAVVGSQPSSNKPIEEQLQGGINIQSVPFDEAGNLLRPLTDDEILTLPNISARSFNFSGDEIKVRLINHNYVPRWIQCGDYKGAGTNWLARMIGMGFTYCTPEDLQPEFREKFKQNEKGYFVIPPDLVLMKMQAIRYYGFIKANMLESLDRVSDKGAKERARAKALGQMRGEAPGGNLAAKEENLPQGGSKNFTGNLQKDKFAFYDPLAGR